MPRSTIPISDVADAGVAKPCVATALHAVCHQVMSQGRPLRGAGAVCLRDWEQRSRLPDSTAKAYLRVIASNPDAVRFALGTDVVAPALAD